MRWSLDLFLQCDDGLKIFVESWSFVLRWDVQKQVGVYSLEKNF
jgi:hypothetical protein